MQLLIPTNKVPLNLVLGIKTQQPQKLVIQVKDTRKPSTLYVSRMVEINGYREFNLNLPQSPPAALLRVFNINNKQLADNSFKITKIKNEVLEQCPIWMNKNTVEFVKFAQQFSENASILSSGEKTPHIYRSNNAKFHIDYYNQIYDNRSKQIISTPARISHNSGIIDVSKKDFLTYTVPMRMIILLHEYAHKYLNPTINKPIAYEIGADINALNIYLSLGYPPSEAHYAFLNVFTTANNEDNAKRYLIIKDFIDKFTTGQFKGSCKFKTNNKNVSKK